MESLLEKPFIRTIIPKISNEQYYKLYEFGIIPEKTELLEGVIVNKVSKSPLHRFVDNLIYEFLKSIFGSKYYIDKEQPLSIQNSEPEPDVYVVPGKSEDYIQSHPTTAVLVVEVSYSTVDVDREKANIYAKANIPEYWLVNLHDRQLEVYTGPTNGKYIQTKILHSEEIYLYQGFELDLKKIFVGK